MNDGTDLIAALAPVAAVLNQLGVRFYVGGSVASSFHGAARSTMDVDLVCELVAENVPAFVGAFGEDFYFSELEWYRKTNETSERQWDDVTRLIRLLGSQADLARLTHNDHCCEQLVQHRRCRSFVDGQRPATLAGCCGAYHTEPLIDVYES